MFSRYLKTVLCKCINVQMLFFIYFVSMEEGAAERCKEAIEKALHYDQNNPEALQLMASYLFSIEKPEVHDHPYTGIPSCLLCCVLTHHPRSIALTHSASDCKSEPDPSATSLMFYAFFNYFFYISGAFFIRFIIITLIRLVICNLDGNF